MIRFCVIIRIAFFSLLVILTIGAISIDSKLIVNIENGIFLMGSNWGATDETPIHPINLSNYNIDRHEVTNARYRECVESGACKAPILSTSRGRPNYFWDLKYSNYPVVFVSWDQADQFCQFVGGRLPTEAEWEKAARGPAPSIQTYPWGENVPDCTRANMLGCIGDTDQVGARPKGKSPYGLMDMAGNVWEWVSDWYGADYYQVTPYNNPKGPTEGTLKVMRGGCWESGANSLRVSCRKAELPKAWGDNIGFRCAYDNGGVK